MQRFAKADWRFWVRLLGALSLVLVAFAHQPLNVGGTRLPDASAYALPDGSIPVICVTLPGDEGGKQASHRLPCAACLVAGSVLVPVPDTIAGHVARPVEPVVFVAIELPVVRAKFPPAAPPQAPPHA
jgi:hypothetical protein